MTKMTKPLCKTCKKYGAKLYLKGRRCETAKCAVEMRDKKKKRKGAFVKRRKISEYGIQLMEKNKVKIYYGVLERQFRRYFDMAKKQQGITGENLLKLLESRLDNTVFRANWVYSRRMAKQVINHGEIRVNGKRVDRPGYVLKSGDTVQLHPESKYLKQVKECIEEYKAHMLPGWMQADSENLSINIVRAPLRDEVTLPINEQLIVNLYSK
ncbi:MAG: 30S ribosomal protein S4 [Candidatus Omnitrophica bacterium]|nr:30S ribosomal protein S4 [Candidatus Omnitrophota bacterium]